MNRPCVMVSSTFYDLRQVRADLTKFIQDDLGYEALLSELSTFPIDPDADTISNCRKRVEDSADIFVLLVGGRYGSIDAATDKSITNLEYLEARSKGIPLYAFVEKRVLSLLEVWSKNPKADYSTIVDTPRIFTFIEMIRSIDKVWVFPFETASEIIETLRSQLSFLYKDALGARAMLRGSGFPEWYRTLTPVALKLALERPKGWEYLLFTQVWIDETGKREDLWFDYDAGLVTSAGTAVSASMAADWMQTRMQELTQYTQSANHLLNTVANQAIGAPGEPGNAFEIVRAAKKLGEVYEAVLSWTAMVKAAHVADPFDTVAREMIKFPDSVISGMRSFPQEAHDALEKAINISTTENPQEVNLTLKFEMSNLEGFEAAIEEATRKFRLS